MATTAQLNQYRLHRDICQALGIPQSRLRHKTKMMGTVSAPSGTGVTRYTGPGAVAGDPAQNILDTLVWLHSSPKPTRGGDEFELGRTSEPRTMGQCPAIDDTGNFITILQDDWIVGTDGQTYKIDTPMLSEDQGFYLFDTELQR